PTWRAAGRRRPRAPLVGRRRQARAGGLPRGRGRRRLRGRRRGRRYARRMTPRLRALTVAVAAGVALVAAGVARPSPGPVGALARAIVLVVPIGHADPRGNVLLVPLAPAPMHIVWHRSR